MDNSHHNGFIIYGKQRTMCVLSARTKGTATNQILVTTSFVWCLLLERNLAFIPKAMYSFSLVAFRACVCVCVL